MKKLMIDQPLPAIYNRLGRECYLDPIRQKLIFITPEETVRQKVISYLINELSVPKGMIGVEVHLSYYGLSTNQRADIIIHKYDETDGLLHPLAIIECKAPGVMLGEKAANQVLDYADALNCDYVMLTDGFISKYSKYDDKLKQYKSLTTLPTYQEMIDGHYIAIKEEKMPPRIAFKELANHLDYQLGYEFGNDTSTTKLIPMMNFYECLLDVSHKMPIRNYGLFRLVEDYGIRFLTYGNAGGGEFSGPYRSFLIETSGSTEFVSIGISAYYLNGKQSKSKTAINVAIDNEIKSHHSLQLSVDENLEIFDNVCSFYHTGRIGIGNIGSGRIRELHEFVKQRYPKILNDERFILGKLIHDKLWYVDDSDVIEFIANLISYALVRDMFRDQIKKRAKK